MTGDTVGGAKRLGKKEGPAGQSNRILQSKNEQAGRGHAFEGNKNQNWPKTESRESSR